jgi:hypothetical protein
MLMPVTLGLSQIPVEHQLRIYNIQLSGKD